MKFALITTFEPDHAFRFCQVVDEVPFGDFNGVLWIPLSDDSITPETHKFNGTEFVLLPPKPTLPTRVDPAECTNTEQPTIL